MFIMTSAVVSCLTSYKKSYARINEDVEKALAMTMAQMPYDVVATDTIQCFRNYISIAELKDTAYIDMLAEGRKTKLVAEAHCDFITVFMLSDQRVSGSLLSIASHLSFATEMMSDIEYLAASFRWSLSRLTFSLPEDI